MFKVPFSEHLWKVEMSKKCTLLWREANGKNRRLSGAKHILKPKFWNTHHVRTTFWTLNHHVQWLLRLAKSEPNLWVLSQFQSRWQAWDVWRGSDTCRVARAVQDTSPSDMLGGQGDYFLRGAAIWSIRSSGLLRWFCGRGAVFRMTWPHCFVAGAVDGAARSQNALVRGRQLCTQPFR